MRDCLNKIILIIVLLSGFGASMLFSQNTQKGQQEHLRLVDEADSLVIHTYGGRDVWEIWGHVHLEQGEAKLTCDRARWWQKDDKVLLNGNVMIYDGKRTLRADRVDYDGQTRTERAFGNVSLEKGDKKLNARRLIYNQELERVSAFEDVVITDLVERASIKGSRAIFERLLDYGLIEGRPQLTKVDTVSNEKLVVHGIKMEAWGEDNRVEVTDSVMIEKGDLKAICRRADFRSDENLLVLKESPTLWHRDHKMKGDRIDIRLEDLSFQGGVIQGKAEIISTDSEFEDIMRGEKITMDVRLDTIRKVIVQGQASSRYHFLEEGDQGQDDQGVNEVNGDRITLTFDGDRIERVKVESDPGQCLGTFTPKTEETKTAEKGKDP